MFSDLILGIDLGTTNSLVGVVDSGFPILLADREGSRLAPSAVHYGPGGEVSTGMAALRQRAVDPGRTVTSVKRLIGRREGESDWEPGYDLRALGKSAIEVSADILRHLKKLQVRSRGGAIAKAVQESCVTYGAEDTRQEDVRCARGRPTVNPSGSRSQQR